MVRLLGPLEVVLRTCVYTDAQLHLLKLELGVRVTLLIPRLLWDLAQDIHTDIQDEGKPLSSRWVERGTQSPNCYQDGLRGLTNPQKKTNL